jgi:hypothetical protein
VGVSHQLHDEQLLHEDWEDRQGRRNISNKEKMLMLSAAPARPQ